MKSKKALFLFVLVIAASPFRAQATSGGTPDLTVARFELGGREKNREILTNGYSPRPGKDGRPEFYFYNEFGTQVMRLVGAAKDDPYFLTEIEVFAVDQSYRERHYQLKDTGSFETASGIFIGFRQSVASMILFPGVTRRDIIGPKDVVKIKGEPDERGQTPDKGVYFVYKIPQITIAGADGNFDYEARYDFYKKKVTRLSLKIAPSANMQLRTDIKAASSVK